MSALRHFVNYAMKFEQAYASGDWKLVEPCFTPAATYATTGAEAFAGTHEGRDAILAYFASSTGAFDKRFDSREVIVVDGPEERGDHVWMRWRAIYRLAGAPNLEMEGESSAYFEGERMRRLEDWMPPEYGTRDRRLHAAARRQARAAALTPESTTMRYRLLGRTGLRVSELCLGTMTFGTDWGWGSSEESAAKIFDRYVEAGGNFIDTADGYVNGKSEEMLGRFIADRGLRDAVVLATKFTFNTERGNPNAGGNGRKNVYRALEGSLRRLRTDYLDLYWLHAWDMLTPVEEVVATFDHLVRDGKVRYVGLSDVPAWYLARAQTIAELRGLERIAALQLEYSLIERNIEREHVPAALELGVGLCPWSPLASGFLSGKYARETGARGDGRLEAIAKSGNPAFTKILANERNWDVLDELRRVAQEVGRSPAQVALSWVYDRPGVTSTIIGATKLSQLDDNLAAAALALPPALAARLDEASAPERVNPYVFFGPEIQSMITGGVAIEPSTGRRAP